MTWDELFKKLKIACACGEKRSWLMIINARHYEGCPEIRKRPSAAVPILALAMTLMLGCATPPPPAPTRTRSRYCTNSKACGDGCIPYEHECHKPAGTACTVVVHE